VVWGALYIQIVGQGTLHTKTVGRGTLIMTDCAVSPTLLYEYDRAWAIIHIIMINYRQGRTINKSDVVNLF